MKAKTKIGIKPKKKKKRKRAMKKRILSMMKRGGAFLSMLGALGSLIGGAISVAKSVNERAKPRDVSSRSCNVTIVRWNRAADYISPRTNMDADCISASTNRTGRSSEEQKNVKETIKIHTLVQLQSGSFKI